MSTSCICRFRDRFSDAQPTFPRVDCRRTASVCTRQDRHCPCDHFGLPDGHHAIMSFNEDVNVQLSRDTPVEPLHQDATQQPRADEPGDGVEQQSTSTQHEPTHEHASSSPPDHDPAVEQAGDAGTSGGNRSALTHTSGESETAEVGPADETVASDSRPRVPKTEVSRPPPIVQPYQPQQPVVSQGPVRVPAVYEPPAIIAHVRSNFGPVLGDQIEREVYRRGWLNLNVDDLHEMLRTESGALFGSLKFALGDQQLAAAVHDMIQGILHYHHHDQTPQLMRSLTSSCALHMLFEAMLNPIYLKNLVEMVLTTQARRAQQQQQQAVPTAPGAVPSGSFPGRAGPVGVAPHPHVDLQPNSNVGNALPGAAASAGRRGPGSPPAPRTGNSPTATGAPAIPPTRSMQNKMLQEQHQQPHTGVTSGHSGRLLQPQQPNPHAGIPDLSEQQQYIFEAKAKLQQTIGVPPQSLPGHTRPSPAPLHGVQQYGSGGFGSDSHGAFGPPTLPPPTQPAAQPQPPPTPTSTTSSVPYSPLAAAFSAARQPKTPSQPSSTLQSPSSTFEPKQKNLAEGLQSLLRGGNHAGRVSMGAHGAVVSASRGELSWADTDDEVEALAQFLAQHKLQSLQTPLSRNTTLSELRSMGQQEFEETVPRWIASANVRKQLAQALHPGGKFPPDRRSLRQPQGTAPAPGIGPAGSGIPAPRSRNAPAAVVSAAKSQPPQASSLAAPTSKPDDLLYLRLKLLPADADSPQPTDAVFHRDAVRQLPSGWKGSVRFVDIVWSKAKGCQIPTLIFSIPRAIAESAPRAMEDKELVFDKVRYSISKCTLTNSAPPSQQQQQGERLSRPTVVPPSAQSTQPAPVPSSVSPGIPRSPKQRPAPAPAAATTPNARRTTPDHGPAKAGGRPPALVAAPASISHGSTPVCRYFALPGSCRKGAECPYRHEGPSPAVAPAPAPRPRTSTRSAHADPMEQDSTPARNARRPRGSQGTTANA
jgi:hypothetical protein